MKRVKILTKSIAIILCMALCFGIVPAGAIGNNFANSSKVLAEPVFEKEKEPPHMITEVVEKRTSNEKHFMMSDKSFSVIQYGEPVHYQKDGKWEDIDNTLTASKAKDAKGVAGIENASNDFKVKFAKNINAEKLVTITKGDYQISWNVAGTDAKQRTTETQKEAVVKNPDLVTVEKGDEKFTKLKKLSSDVLYEDVFPSTDIRYTLKSNSLKEDIIVNEKQDAYEYAINIQTNKVKLTLNEKGEISATDIADPRKVVFIIPAPVMYDADNQWSDAVSYILSESDSNEYVLTIKADAGWINDEKTKLPVRIDPVIETPQNSNNIVDTYVDNAVPTTKLHGTNNLLVGNNSLGRCRTYVGFDIPSLPKEAVIYQAVLAIYQYQHDVTSSGVKIRAYDSSTTNEPYQDFANVTWNNQKDDWLTLSPIADYVDMTNTDGWKCLDITAIGKKWYETGTKFGADLYRAIALRSSDESASARVGFVSNDSNLSVVDTSGNPIPISTLFPYVIFNYRLASGLESYWDYETQDMGPGGTGYVNKYTGALTYVANGVSENGNALPLNIDHVYNDTQAGLHTGKKAYSGLGWQMNISQSITEVTDSKLRENGYRYIYLDGDGTKHYFKLNDSGKMIDEDGLGLTLTINTIDPSNYYVITDKKSNRIKFTQSGYFHMIMQTGGRNFYVAYSGDTPNRIYNGAGQYTTFGVDAATGVLQTFTDPANRVTSYAYYPDSTLRRISNIDGTFVEFTYSNGSKLESVNYNNSKKIVYTRDTKGRVINVVEVGKSPDGTLNERGQEVGFSYGLDKTMITTSGSDDVYGTSDDMKTSYVFDSTGSVITSYDNKGAVMAQENNDNNKIEKYGYTAKQSNNVLYDSSNERGGVWATSVSQSGSGNDYGFTGMTDQPMVGTKSFNIRNSPRMPNQCFPYYYQNIPVGSNRYYTISVYVKTNLSNIFNKGAQIRAVFQGTTYYSDYVSGTNTEWQRLSLTVYVGTVQAGQTMNVQIGVDTDSGYAYFDCAQAEFGTTAGRYNILENSDFSAGAYVPDSWTGTNLSASDVTTSGDSSVDGSKAMRIVGDVTKEKSIKQSIPVNAICNKDIFIFSGWAKAESLPYTTGSGRYFALDVGIVYADGTTTEWRPINFSSDTGQPQFISEVIMGKKENTGKVISHLVVYCLYYKNANTAYFDNLQLVQDSAGSYTYDSNNNVVSTVDKAKTESSFNYTNNNLNSMVNPDGTAFTYSYDDEHQMVEARSSNDVGYSITYNSLGDPNSSVTRARETAKSITAGTNYYLTSVNSSWQAVINGSGQDISGTTIVNWYERSTNTQWKPIYVEGSGSNTYYRIVNAASADGKALTVQGSANVDGTNVILQTYSGATGQLWKFVKNNDDTCRLVPKCATNKCLEEPKDITPVPGEILKIRTYDSTKTDDANQRWNVDLVNQPTGQIIMSEAAYVQNGNYVDKITDSLGNVVDYYNEPINGLLKTVKDPKGNDTYYTYKQSASRDIDRVDKVSKENNYNTSSTRYTYDNDGRLSTIKPHTDNDTFYYQLNYDKFGNMYNTKVGTQNLMTNGYNNGNGKLTQSTYGNWDTIGYTYDDYGRVNSKKYNLTTRFTYQYDGDGNLQTYTDNQTGMTQKYSYDLVKRLQNVRYSNGYSMGFQYDSFNRLTSYYNNYVYDYFKTSFVYGTGASAASKKGLIYGVKVNDAQKLTYTYDGLARLSRKNITGTANNYAMNYSYVNGTGNKTSTLLASVQNGADTLSYTYDKNGNIETISKNGVLQVKYYYDKLNQVWREDNEVLQKTIYYGYDVGGNITGKYTWDLFYADGPSSAPLTTVLYEYNDASWKDKLTAYNGQEITYDEIGNPLTYGDQEFYWEGRQLQATSGTWGWSYYQYNDSGIRTQKGINGNLTFYHLNGDKVVREEGGPYGALDYFYDDAGNLFSFRMNGAEYFYIRNGQNDIIGILDSTGTQVVSYSYDTWGNILSITGSMADTVGQANPYRYKGYRYDSDTGLYYLNSRYYNPQWGRFINADGGIAGAGDIQGNNMFQYCFNNPVNMLDPTGLWPTWDDVWNGVGEFADGFVSGVNDAVVNTFTGIYRNLTTDPITHIKNAFNNPTSVLPLYDTFENVYYGVGDLIQGKPKEAGQKLGGAMVGVTVAVVSGGTAKVIAPKIVVPKACFVAGTLIAAEQGYVPIETIKAGQYVYAENPETGEKGLKQVVRTFIKKSDKLVHITVNGETITTTPEHPFYVPQQGWTESKNLYIGDMLVLKSGSYTTIEKIQYELLKSPINVYNFEVEDFHTYYVGENSILVHNTCFNINQQAAISLAKDAKTNGLSMSDAKILTGWGKEYGFRKSEIHMGHSRGTNPITRGPHAQIGPIDHIQIFPD